MSARAAAGQNASPSALPALHPWNDIASLAQGFLGRAGGVSAGPFAELNLSSLVGDDVHNVRANWSRVAESLPHLEIVRIRQVHGETIVRAEDLHGEIPEADAVITHAPHLLLTVLTADCVPLLMVDSRSGAIAAVHAGWRGTLAGLAPKVVRALGAAFGTRPEDLRVALGPAIGACCYEVGHEIVDQLQERWGAMPAAVTPASGQTRPHLDLRAANTHLLHAAGVRDIKSVGPCTRCAHTQFFSHRHASQGKHAPLAGRQAAYIGWRGSKTR